MPRNLPNHIGKYRVIAKLGQGGMAQVLLTMAEGPAGFSKLMVVKQLREELAEDPEFLTMFLDEARLAALLNHRNVVHTYEVVSEPDAHFIVMEYLEGQPLNRILSKVSRKEIPLELHLRVLSETLAGLHYAHELKDFDGTPLNVIHRDVSPQNIFVTYDGQVKLVDFGIAKAAGAANLTKAGVFKGKVGYMAPEQARAEPVDRRADIFAVGVMMWEALVRKRLTKGKQDLVVLNARIHGTESRLSELELDLDPELVEICDKAMAHDRDERYETADQFRDALDGYLDHTGKRVDDRSIAQFVSMYFSSHREKLREKVEAQVKMHAEARPSKAGSAVPVLIIEDPVNSWRDSLDNTGTDQVPSSVFGPESTSLAEEGQTAATRQSPLTGSGTVNAADVEVEDEAVSNTGGTVRRFATETAPRAEGRSRMTLFAVAGLLGLGALLFFVSRGGGEGETTGKAAASTAAPTAPVTPPATATAVIFTPEEAKNEDTVAFSLTVTPKDAKVKLDGSLLGRNPFSARVKRDGSMHRLRVERKGYKTIDQMVTFDRDVSLELELEEKGSDKKSRPRGPRGPRPRPQPTSTAAEQPPPPPPPPRAPGMGEDLTSSGQNGKKPRGIDVNDPYKQ